MTQLRVQIGVASRAMPGEIECGDHAGTARDADRWFVALADGVGHGPEAAFAARAALASILRDPWGELEAMIARCHREIATTRGVALALLRVHAGSGVVEHVGVGNVDVTGSTREALRWVASPGIVGARVRKVRATRQQLHPGDILVVHTDGVSRRLDLGRHYALDPRSLASRLLEDYASPTDDAACVVVRC